MDFEKTLSHFEGKTRHGDKIMAFCPAHDDKNASLSIRLANDRMLIYCHAGCSIEDIIKAAGITYADMFTNKPPVAIYQYRKADGSYSHEKLKYQTPKGKHFRQRRETENGIVDNLETIARIPYNLPAVLKATKEGATILYVEGEKDAETARLLRYTATTMGGASDWKDEYKHYFKGACMVQIPDKDDAGLKLAENVIKSLTTVARSLKVVILPDGKDLTEWVNLGNGNSDLATLISNSPDLVKAYGISKPNTAKLLNGYAFTWDDLNLIIKIERLTDNATGIIKVLDNGNVIHTSNINLLATRSLVELANRLKKHRRVDWDVILSNIANFCVTSLEDSGIDEDINQEPSSMKVEYLLEPLLPKNEPTTIFTAGGKGKSIFADYIAVLVQNGICADGGLPFVPFKSNVLYLDWEADAETHRRYITAIKRGLGRMDSELIHYRKLDHPLSKVIDELHSAIAKYDIELVIIDSQMAATASGTQGLTEAQVASEYYNNLRSLGCTTLTIDHITKQSMTSTNGTEAPYGSVVKYNRSRSQFELRLPDNDENLDHKEFALVHRKFNLGPKQKPLGIAVDFFNKDNELVRIEFRQCDLIDNPLLNKVIPRKTRLINALKVLGQASIKELAEYIGEPDNQRNIGAQLANDKKTFVRISEGIYGLLA